MAGKIPKGKYDVFSLRVGGLKMFSAADYDPQTGTLTVSYPSLVIGFSYSLRQKGQEIGRVKIIELVSSSDGKAVYRVEEI